MIVAVFAFLLGIFAPAFIMARAYPKRAVRPHPSRVEPTLIAYIHPGWTEGSGLLRSIGLGATSGVAAWATVMLRRRPADLA